MLALCDYVVVATPLTPETHHMISDAAFAAMKPNAVVINIGRGPVIDQAALVRALRGTENQRRGSRCLRAGADTGRRPHLQV